MAEILIMHGLQERGGVRFDENKSCQDWSAWKRSCLQQLEKGSKTAVL
jgi:hypothetical protein